MKKIEEKENKKRYYITGLRKRVDADDNLSYDIIAKDLGISKSFVAKIANNQRSVDHKLMLKFKELLKK